MLIRRLHPLRTSYSYIAALPSSNNVDKIQDIIIKTKTERIEYIVVFVDCERLFCLYTYCSFTEPHSKLASKTEPLP